MLRIIPPLFVFFLSVSCASVQGGAEKPDRAKLESENHLIRKRLIAVERRNSILEEENIKHKKDNRDLKASIENLRAEIKSHIEKHKGDERMWAQRHENIMKKNEILEKESSEKLKEMSDLNKKIESDLRLQISQLGEEMSKKERAAAKFLEDEKKGAAAREFDLSSQLEKNKKELLKRDEMILGLEERVKRRDAKISALEDDAKKNLSAAKGADETKTILEKENLDLKRRTNALDQKIKELEAENAKLKNLPAAAETK